MMFRSLFQRHLTMRLTQVGPESGIKTDTAGVLKCFIESKTFQTFTFPYNLYRFVSCGFSCITLRTNFRLCRIIKGDYNRACRKSFAQSSGRGTRSSRQLFPRVLTHERRRHAHHKKKLTQNIAGSGYGPCCYARIPCTSVKRSHSRIEIPYRKRNKL
jgi:hypothetical protein